MFTLAMQERPYCPASRPTLLVLVVDVLGGCEVVALRGVTCISPAASDGEYVFMCLVTFCVVFGQMSTSLLTLLIQDRHHSEHCEHLSFLCER